MQKSAAVMRPGTGRTAASRDAGAPAASVTRPCLTPPAPGCPVSKGISVVDVGEGAGGVQRWRRGRAGCDALEEPDMVCVGQRGITWAFPWRQIPPFDKSCAKVPRNGYGAPNRQWRGERNYDEARSWSETWRGCGRRHAVYQVSNVLKRLGMDMFRGLAIGQETVNVVARCCTKSADSVTSYYLKSHFLSPKF